MTDTRYDQRPILRIDGQPCQQVGRCLNKYVYKITSNKPLEASKLESLCVMLGMRSGQAWTLDGPVEEMMTYVSDGKDWRGQPYGSVSMPVWVYTVVDLIDSSD